MSAEFDCVECKRHIVAIVAEKIPEPPLCCHCLFMPGWHEDPVLAPIIDPDRRVPEILRPAAWIQHEKDSNQLVWCEPDGDRTPLYSGRRTRK